MSLIINKMSVARRFLSIILLVYSVSSNAQDSVSVSFDHTKELIGNFQVQQGVTLYSLARLTGNDITDLKSYNHKSQNHLSINEKIKAPIRVKLDNQCNKQEDCIQLTYTVGKGDNLFRLSQHTGVSVANLLAQNQKTDANLSIGEQLSLGFLHSNLTMAEPLYEEKSEVHFQHLPSLKIRSIPSYEGYERLSVNIDTANYTPPQIIVKKRGIAYWERRDYQNSELVVMHPTARLNTNISLYNPMLNRKVEAKVVRELPRESYPEDISVVISPSVANALGALDKRFLVEMTYIE